MKKAFATICTGGQFSDQRSIDIHVTVGKFHQPQNLKDFLFEILEQKTGEALSVTVGITDTEDFKTTNVVRLEFATETHYETVDIFVIRKDYKVLKAFTEHSDAMLAFAQLVRMEYEDAHSELL